MIVVFAENNTATVNYGRNYGGQRNIVCLYLIRTDLYSISIKKGLSFVRMYDVNRNGNYYVTITRGVPPDLFDGFDDFRRVYYFSLWKKKRINKYFENIFSFISGWKKSKTVFFGLVEK